MKRLLSFLIVGFICSTAWAHKGSDAYLDIQHSDGSLHFTLAVALKDLDLLLPIDANSDGNITWGEIQAAIPSVLVVLEQQSGPLSDDAACQLRWEFDGLERRSDGAYLRVGGKAQCAAESGLSWRYTLFKEQDANHRLIVTGQLDGRELLATASPIQVSPLPLRQGNTSTTAARGRMATAFDYLALGMHHLLEGYDHLAFLLALVLPLRLQWGRRASPPPNAQPSPWIPLLRTVTAFTIGHSITLALATLGFTQGSPAWVEPVIAASIGVTALLNLFPVKVLQAERLALVFGLVHGYGFAGLLIEAAAPAGLLPWALAGFNLGVEAGQLVAVGGWVLLSQLLVDRSWYHTVVVRGGSWVLTVLAAFWFWQRV